MTARVEHHYHRHQLQALTLVAATNLSQKYRNRSRCALLFFVWFYQYFFSAAVVVVVCFGDGWVGDFFLKKKKLRRCLRWRMLMMALTTVV